MNVYSVVGYMIDENDEITGYALVRYGCGYVIYVTIEQAEYLLDHKLIKDDLWVWIMQNNDFDTSKDCIVYKRTNTGVYVLYTMYAYLMSLKTETERFDLLRKELEEQGISIKDTSDISSVLLDLTEHSSAAVRLLVAKYGFNLGYFLFDDDVSVRIMVAKHGYGLDTLISDVSEDVRCYVAKCAFEIKTLMCDESVNVRRTLARMGLCFDFFLRDEDVLIREIVANAGYGLEYLISDEEPRVRIAVAGNGYGIDILVDDKNSLVRASALRYRKSGKAELPYRLPNARD